MSPSKLICFLIRHPANHATRVQPANIRFYGTRTSGTYLVSATWVYSLVTIAVQIKQSFPKFRTCVYIQLYWKTKNVILGFLRKVTTCVCVYVRLLAYERKDIKEYIGPQILWNFKKCLYLKNWFSRFMWTVLFWCFKRIDIIWDVKGVSENLIWFRN